MPLFRLFVFILAASMPSFATGAELRQSDFNDAIVKACRAMPSGGGYSASTAASRLLASSMSVTAGTLVVDTRHAAPSFCSSATYLLFVSVISQLIEDGSLTLSSENLKALLVHGQADGEGVWGRWNANGPGTARLFKELGLGDNFTDFAEARPGDFMKIFWTPEIGVREHGHSVVYLGALNVGGVESVRFWSSNQSMGYGEKTVARSKIAQALFSRLERPANLSKIAEMPKVDPYLSSLLSKPSSPTEMRRMCGY